MTNRAERFCKWATIGHNTLFCQETIMQAEILLTLKLQQRLFADPRRITLLKQIDHTGSISQGRSMRVSAIRALGMPSMR